MAREAKRINIIVPVDTLERIDSYAYKMSISRTAAILVLCSQSLDNQKVIEELGEIVKLYKEKGK